MSIRTAESEDYLFLKENDKHISPNEIKSLINQKRILLFCLDGKIISWLRWGLF